MAELSRRQEEIVDAALEIISAEGMESLTVKGIADRVGFKDAAVYRHFESKQAIIEAIVARLETHSLGMLQTISASPDDALEKLRLFFLDRCRLFSEQRPLVAVMFAEEMFRQSPEVSARYAAMMEKHQNSLSRIIRAGQADGQLPALPPDHLFTVVVGALRLLVTRWKLSGHTFDLERSGRAVWDSLAALIQAELERQRHARRSHKETL